MNDDIYLSQEDIANSSFGEKNKTWSTYCYGWLFWFRWRIKKIEKFLTVLRKFNYIYILSTQKNQSGEWFFHKQTFLIFFLQSVLLESAQKILEGVCNRKTRKYVSQPALWISRSAVCLTLDCSVVNKDGPERFRTELEKPNF